MAPSVRGTGICPKPCSPIAFITIEFWTVPPLRHCSMFHRGYQLSTYLQRCTQPMKAIQLRKPTGLDRIKSNNDIYLIRIHWKTPLGVFSPSLSIGIASILQSSKRRRRNFGRVTAPKTGNSLCSKVLNTTTKTIHLTRASVFQSKGGM